MNPAGLPDRLAAPALLELWRRAWRAMAKAGPSGWPDVRTRVPVPDAEARLAIGGLLGRPVRAGTATVAIGLGELDGALTRAGDGWGLVAVVEAVGGTLPDRASDTIARAAAIDASLRAARGVGPGAPWFAAWLEDVGADGTVARLLGRDELHLLPAAAAVLAALPADAEPLPVLATRLFADTKAFSTGALPGLVLRGIAASLGEETPRSAAGRRALWEAVGVVPDDLASQVLVLNLPVLAGAGLAGWLAGAASEGVPFRVTLHQLARFELTIAVAGRVVVSVCENPAVLRSAAERLGPASASVVCTEGRPSVACTRLLDLLVDGGCELRYHGDFDWPGLRIATPILARRGVVPWRYEVADYERARSHPPPGGSRPVLAGPPAPSPWDPRLAASMAQAGEVVYEEDVIDLLVTDLRPVQIGIRDRSQ